jgi:hypothetical protein
MCPTPPENASFEVHALAQPIQIVEAGQLDTSIYRVFRGG